MFCGGETSIPRSRYLVQVNRLDVTNYGIGVGVALGGLRDMISPRIWSTVVFSASSWLGC